MYREVFSNKFKGLDKPLFMINSETFPSQAKSFDHPKCHKQILTKINSNQFDDITVLESSHGHQTDAVVVLSEVIEMDRMKEGKLPRMNAHLIYQL